MHVHGERVCVVCQRRPYERAQVCNPCRKWLARDLGEIAGLAALLPLVTAPTRSVEGGIPLRIAAVDLALPAVGGASAGTVCDPYRDQYGEIPVAARLDSWAQDWAITRGLGEHLPVPTVNALVGWLLNRVEDECDQHPAIDEFAGEIRGLLATIRRTLSTEAPRAVRYAAPCPRCGTETLRRTIGADWIECESCGRLWGEEDYAELVRDAVPQGRLLTTLQAAVYAGVKPGRIRLLAHYGKLRQVPGPWGWRPKYDPAEVRQVLKLERESERVAA
jgi:ribosomal protein L37AE/L43A